MVAKVIKDPRFLDSHSKNHRVDTDSRELISALRKRLVSGGYPREVCQYFSEVLTEILSEHPDLKGQFSEVFFDLITEAARKNSAGATMALLSTFNDLSMEGRDSLLVWSDAIKRLLGLASRHLDDFMHSVPTLLDRGLLHKIENWIIACSRGSGLDSRVLGGHLRLETRSSNHWLSQNIDAVSLNKVLRKAKAEVNALWGCDIHVSEIPVLSTKNIVKRSSFYGSRIRLPRSYPGIKGELSEAIHVASLHHIASHLRFRSKPFEKGSLKPIQIALTSVLEDCRCELLALEIFPGLSRVWDLFNTKIGSTSLSAENVFKRLSYKILNPEFHDANGWITKAFESFYDNRNRWDDEDLSRELGNLLGNDLGQMRIQFNAKTYLPSPIYRDDNQGIWDFDDDIDNAESAAAGAGVDVEFREQDQGKEKKNSDIIEPSKKVNSIPLQAESQPKVIQTQGEFDYLNGVFLDDFVTLKSYPFKSHQRAIDPDVEFEQAVNSIALMIESVSVNKHHLKRAVAYGDRLNIDAAISTVIDLKMGASTDENYYDLSLQKGKSLSVQIVLDVSESTKDRVGEDDSKRLLDVALRAVDILGTSLTRAKDPFSVFTFCSDGREDVRIGLIKDYRQSWDLARSRLYSTEAGFSTRTGAAIRFAGQQISRADTYRKLVLVITDGEPFDLDVSDEKYFIEDARHAVSQVRQQSIDVYCIGLGDKSNTSLERVYGKGRYSVIKNTDQLAERIGSIYAVLSKQ
jgi:uncharacterized protein YegL